MINKEIIFIQSCPDDDYYLWQVHTWIESLKELNKSNLAVNLIFIPNFREFNTKWNKLVELYPEAKWIFIKDEDNISKFLSFYIPILRPYCLSKFFEKFPEMSQKAIFYCDADVIFTENFKIDDLINDDICYVSDTLSYINASYFDSKIKDVLPDKLEQYKERDILNEACQLVGITREIAEKNNSHSGGAQYLLKNIDAKFWKEVMVTCLQIRGFLMSVNRHFFESESKGFQSWASDMWAVLWTLWKKEKEVRIVPEMNFAWSSDRISKLNSGGILHNAGISSNTMDNIPVFFKGNYVNGNDPFEDPHLYKVYNDEKSKTLCNHYYVSKMIETKNKYNINFK